MKAIILIAGMGTRLKPLTDKMPKCLTEVNEKAILENALESLDKIGVTEVMLVIGYLGDKVRGRVGEKFGSMKITYAENDIYNKTNNSFSLWLAIKDFDESEPVLILEGDVFFDIKLIRALLDEGHEDVTAVEKYNPKLDGSFVSIDSQGIVDSWVHKKHRPEGYTVEDKYKTINIHKYSPRFVREFLIPSLKEHIDETGGTEPIEYIFKEIIKKGGKIYAFDAKGIDWFEVDDANDLKIAEEIFK